MYPLDDGVDGLAAFNVNDNYYSLQGEMPTAVPTAAPTAAPTAVPTMPMPTAVPIPTMQFGGGQPQGRSEFGAMAAEAPAPMTSPTPRASTSMHDLRTAAAAAPVYRAPPLVQPQQQQQQSMQRVALAAAPQPYAITPPSHLSHVQAQPSMMYAYPAVAPQHDDGAPGFLDAMWSKRRELLKLLVLSMVILFAVSTHWSVCHYAKLYIDQMPYDKSVWAEVAVRVGYPALVLLLLWILKTPSASSSRRGAFH